MRPWLRPLPFALLGAYGLARISHASVDDAAPSRSAALCTALASADVRCTAEDVVWVVGPSGVAGAMRGKARALVRGRDKEDALDLFSVPARLSPEGRLLDLEAPFNLTHSNGADEGLPIVKGSLVAYVVSVQGQPEAVHILDLAGHEPKAYEDLTSGQRLQVKIADLQATGHAHGIKKTVYGLVPAPKSASLAFRPDGMLAVETDVRTLVIDPQKGNVVDGVAFVRVTPEVVAKPPTFGPWMSDRLRAATWFGDEKNQFLKVVVFTGMEWIKGKKAQLTGDTGEKEAQDDMGAVTGSGGPAATFTDPEIGWPPKALDPMIKPPIAGEGQWVSLEKDPFITPIPGIGAPFVTTFVRTDPAAQHTRVYVTLWDPRLVSLHMEAGTVEPVGATGEAGPGQIARTPEVIRHVVGGFNGGFQATHGEFGMQANGVLYLPPKPYAATVMELRDGTTGFGPWPKAQDVPDDVLSFRQNMTALVQNEKYNPWGRAWWGGVPPGWHDAVHTTRSGLCLTKDNFVAYFFGHDIGPEPLGRAMIVAHCVFGLHLDMNPGLAGFEFYNVQPASTFQPLGRPLQNDWEYEGLIKDMPEFKFRARRMIKSMGHILFPRYVQRDARDFFYLTARTVLPGPALPKAEADETWRTKGLPQHGFPYASAITKTKISGDHKVRVLRLDPRTMKVDASTEGSNDNVVALFGKPPRAGKHGKDAGAPSPAAGGTKLWLGAHVFAIDKSAPTNATAIADVVPFGAPGSSDARAAVGISDEDGMLQWVELMPDDRPDPQSGAAMLELLEKVGCSARGLVTSDIRAYLGGTMDIGGDAGVPAQVTTRLIRTPAPSARFMFDNVEIVQQAVWQPLQSQKVKWRPTKAPPEKPAASASASASGSAVKPPQP